MTILTIDGVDISPYIEHNGFKWERNDVDGPNAGRDLSGYMWRGRVASKVRLDITIRSLTTSELSVILKAIKPQYVTVTYLDPEVGGMKTATMYSNNNPATCITANADDITRAKWGSISFPLVER